MYEGMDLRLGLSGLGLFMAKGLGLGFMALDVLGFSPQALSFSLELGFRV